ncbi:MAG: amidohydrolase family protein, partial [Erysipelotrichaceae bacterium]|nr:amidohydrolase family protein [Erysipelotrichaceae bacterium]
MTNIYKGTIIYSVNRETLSVNEDSYLIVEDGFVKEITGILPEEYKTAEVTDYGKKLIIPAFSDLHIHAAQYVQRGIGMDKLLFDWLNDYTFPQESNFKDMTYAKTIYDQLVNDMIKHGTFHASLFTTIHYDASDYLFQKFNEKGLYGYIGKVNMDMNSPEFLCEDTEESLRETERFVKEHLGYRTVKPILTPRFAPTCSEKLIRGLGEIAGKYHVGLQTHLVESIAEKEWTLELFKNYRADGEIYEKNGLVQNGPVIFAHVIFPSELDKEILKKYHCVSVHCPEATNNIIAGIMPVHALQDEGLDVAIGTDVGGGSSVQVYRQIARAARLSKLKEFYEPEGNKQVLFANAFYMATK